MKGTEKQIAWANDIVARMDKFYAGLEAEASARGIALPERWADRKSKFYACDSAAHIIDFFGYVTADDPQMIAGQVASCYKVRLNNGYDFK